MTSDVERENLERKYLGKRVHVVIDDPYHPINKDGVVVCVDSMCQLHGTWGGIAAIPNVDSIELL